MFSDVQGVAKWVCRFCIIQIIVAFLCSIGGRPDITAVIAVLGITGTRLYHRSFVNYYFVLLLFSFVIDIVWIALWGSSFTTSVVGSSSVNGAIQFAVIVSVIGIFMKLPALMFTYILLRDMPRHLPGEDRRYMERIEDEEIPHTEEKPTAI
eukprot:TRINITY_DN1295_c0_g2_i1.p1 TRINITY_DN1295_c0_g2~~TRINITY_DN1295_c0_g2_i1.p1  ORF type:complete len:152 (+),score=31.86 TRINITY_DN1295_c0_g2_i1:150-605(+)